MGTESPEDDGSRLSAAGRIATSSSYSRAVGLAAARGRIEPPGTSSNAGAIGLAAGGASNARATAAGAAASALRRSQNLR